MFMLYRTSELPNLRRAYFNSVDLTKNRSVNRHNNDIRERLATRLKTSRKMAWVGLYLFTATMAILGIVSAGI